MNAGMKKLSEQVRAYRYDIGAWAYLLGLCALARESVGLEGVWGYVFLVLAVPFVGSVEHFFCVVLLLSTLWGYFPGTLVGLSSLYIWLAALIAARAVLGPRPSRARVWPLLLLALLGVTAAASWLRSAYSETAGLVTVLILLGMAALLGGAAVFDGKKLTDALARLAFVLTLWYCVWAAAAPYFTRNRRLSIDPGVNVNNFGFSCAILALILFLSLYSGGRKLWRLLGGGAALVLLLLSGSRGALLGLVLACAAVLLLDGKRRYSTRRVLPLAAAAAAVLAAAVFLLPRLGIVRFDLAHLLHSVGTSERLELWKTLLAYLFTGGSWLLGWGPGTVCTRQVFQTLLGREVYHAHNTFLEAFGELGAVGLALTAVYILLALLWVVRRSRTDAGAYLLLGLAVYLLVHGMVESFYQTFFFWAVFALCGRGGGKGEVRGEGEQDPDKAAPAIPGAERK